VKLQEGRFSPGCGVNWGYRDIRLRSGVFCWPVHLKLKLMWQEISMYHVAKKEKKKQETIAYSEIDTSTPTCQDQITP
jgi:hypothetical protein